MDRSPREFQRVRGREGPKSEVRALSVQRARHKTKSRKAQELSGQEIAKAILSLRSRSTQE